MGPHAYVTANRLSGLAASAFAWYTTYGSPSAGAFTPSPDNRSYLNDARMDRQLVVGASVASGVNVIIDMGSALQLTGFAVLNSNAAVQKTDAAVLVEASSNATFAADVNVAKAASTLYSTKAPRNKDHVLQHTTSLTKRYWRLTWTWTGTVTNFSIGELWAYSTVTQLTRRSIYGSGEGKKIYSSTEQFQTGDRRGLKLGGPQRVLKLDWSDLSVSQADELDTMWQAVNGNVASMLWIDSYEASAAAAGTDEQNVVYGRLDEDQFDLTEDDKSLYNTRGFTMRSAGREAGS